MSKNGGQRDGSPEGRRQQQELARRAKERDAEAWGVLFERHYRSVFSFARFKLSGSDEAEDIAAQVFEVAYRSVDRFDYQGVPIEAWLFGIARNLVRDHVRKLGRRGPSVELEEGSVSVSAPDSTANVDLQHDLSAALKGLTDDQQLVLSLRFIEDRSVADTALSMDRSADAVKNLQRRALAALQRQLADSEYGREGPR
ncbi:MAG TPA: sigma-70 family RNA polymerase sigma factor [Dehalococcoidia bacterium]|nr:sigma-70 family RNA polymerase sigma factor [Dehalococcoidia bacterium]